MSLNAWEEEEWLEFTSSLIPQSGTVYGQSRYRLAGWMINKYMLIFSTWKCNVKICKWKMQHLWKVFIMFSKLAFANSCLHCNSLTTHTKFGTQNSIILNTWSLKYLKIEDCYSINMKSSLKSGKPLRNNASNLCSGVNINYKVGNVVKRAINILCCFICSSEYHSAVIIEYTF